MTPMAEPSCKYQNREPLLSPGSGRGGGERAAYGRNVSRCSLPGSGRCSLPGSGRCRGGIGERALNWAPHLRLLPPHHLSPGTKPLCWARPGPNSRAPSPSLSPGAPLSKEETEAQTDAQEAWAPTGSSPQKSRVPESIQTRRGQERLERGQRAGRGPPSNRAVTRAQVLP